MDNTNFKVGNVVQLKSGGPEMTVSEVSGDTILTTWFDRKTHEFLTKEFSGALLNNLTTRREETGRALGSYFFG